MMNKCKEVTLFVTDKANDIEKKLNDAFEGNEKLQVCFTQWGEVLVCDDDLGHPSMSFEKADDVFFVELSNVFAMAKPHALEVKYYNDLYEYYGEKACERYDEVRRLKYRRITEEYYGKMKESLKKATDALDIIVMLFMSRYVTRNQKWV